MRILLAVALAIGLSVSFAAAQTATTQTSATHAPATQTATTQAASTAATKPPADDAAMVENCAHANPQDLSDTGISYGWRQFWGIVCILLLTGAVLALCRWTEVLRGSLPASFEPEQIVPADTNYKVRATYRRFYSLAQSQMTWWFWIVAASFVYIVWMTPHFYTCGFRGGLTPQALILLGIGVATGVGSAIIDQQKQDQNAALNDLTNAAKSLRNPTPTSNQANDLKKLDDAAKELSSQGFLADILSDANGISLHRFQSFAWTLILGLMFVYFVVRKEIAMPEFSTLELSLLGISASTYLGLKIPEKDTNGTQTT